MGSSLCEKVHHHSPVTIIRTRSTDHVSSFEGPYAPAILRFQISFPADYPTVPPVLAFTSDMFHPLVTPQTTYTYTTGALDTETVSATDDERLPRGGLSLRHGFPHWFERSRESAASPRRVSESAPLLQHKMPRPSALDMGLNRLPSPSHIPLGEQHSSAERRDDAQPSIVEILEYFQSVLTDENVLDSIPSEAVANSGAYHAWRAYRAGIQKTQRFPSPQPPLTTSRSSSREEIRRSGERQSNSLVASKSRLPGEWNWTGVWEERVKKVIRDSTAESVLFTNATGNTDTAGVLYAFCHVQIADFAQIRFSDMDDDVLREVRKKMAGSYRIATASKVQ